MSARVSQVVLPQLGVNDQEVTIIEWRVQSGQAVHVGQVIADVETSKANLELSAEGDGFIFPIATVGSAVPIGTTIALLLDSPDAERAEEYTRQLAGARVSPPHVAADGELRITDKARRLIELHKIDPARLPSDRIVREKDVLALIQAQPIAVDLPEALVRRVAIYGASQGGLALLDCLRQMDGYEAVAFLDDAPDLAGGEYEGLPVWPGSSLDQLIERQVGSVVTHIAKGSARLSLLERCRAAGVNPLNLIHPSAIVSPSVTMGQGNVVKAGAVLDADVRLGNACIIDNGSIVPHHNEIGDACHLAPGVRMGGDCRIGELTIIGIGATISARLKIGRNVLVAAGACVVRDVPDNAIVEGNPGRITGTRKGH